MYVPSLGVYTLGVGVVQVQVYIEKIKVTKVLYLVLKTSRTDHKSTYKYSKDYKPHMRFLNPSTFYICVEVRYQQ